MNKILLILALTASFTAISDENIALNIGNKDMIGVEVNQDLLRFRAKSSDDYDMFGFAYKAAESRYGDIDIGVGMIMTDHTFDETNGFTETSVSESTPALFIEWSKGFFFVSAAVSQPEYNITRTNFHFDKDEKVFQERLDTYRHTQTFFNAGIKIGF